MFLSDDDMIECPYNKTHRMLRKRLQPHLLKCRKQYPDVELRKCPFNITHLIPDPEYAHHATNCPDRKLLTQYKYDAPEPKEEEVPKHAPVECDESWDDTDVVDYDPKLHLKKSKILMKPESRYERKLFLKKESESFGVDEERYAEFGRNEPASSGSKRHRDVYEPRAESAVSYSQEMRSRYRNRSTSPCSSSYSRQRSHSPISKTSRRRSRSRSRSRSLVRSRRDYSPTRRSTARYSRSPSLVRSHRDYSPERYSSPRYSYYPPPPPYAYYDHYYRTGGRIANGDHYYSIRDGYYSYEAPYSRYYEGIPSMPRAPPPPFISYPSPRPHGSRYPYPE